MIRVPRLMAAALFSAAITMVTAENLEAQSCGTDPEPGFVICNWLASDSTGHAIGTTTIRKAYGSCVLIERWHGMEASDEGLGVLGYDGASGSWRREYLDSRGFVLNLAGRSDGRTLIMTGNDYDLDVARGNRVTWTARADGTVERRMETSSDEGRTWQLHSLVLLRRIAE